MTHPLKGRRQSDNHVAKRRASFLRNGKLKGKIPWNKGKVNDDIADLSGLRFGRLVVIERAGSYVFPGGKSCSQWKCRCDCGVEKIILRQPLIRGLTVSCGCFNKEKAAKQGRSNTGSNNGMYNKKGPKNPCWNHNLTDEERASNRRYDKKEIEWRKLVKERDGYTCQICGQIGTVLNSHHIEPYCKSKKLRYDMDNGITLCNPCHTMLHKIYGDDCNAGSLGELRLSHGLLAAS